MATANDPVRVTAPALEDHAGEDAKEALATENRMRDYFAGRPKVAVKTKADESVQVNGYTFIVKGGERVNVPVDVADLLEAAGLI